MTPGISVRLKQIAKVLATLCAIELCVPGGTLIVLGLLLTARVNVPAPVGGPMERVWSALQRIRAAWSARRT